MCYSRSEGSTQRQMFSCCKFVRYGRSISETYLMCLCVCLLRASAWTESWRWRVFTVFKGPRDRGSGVVNQLEALETAWSCCFIMIAHDVVHLKDEMRPEQKFNATVTCIPPPSHLGPLFADSSSSLIDHPHQLLILRRVICHHNPRCLDSMGGFIWVLLRHSSITE